MGLRGFYSSIIVIIRGGILKSTGNFLESSSQAILAGVMLVGRLGVCHADLCYALSVELSNKLTNHITNKITNFLSNKLNN